MKNLKMELSRGLRTGTFKVSLLIGCLICLLNRYNFEKNIKSYGKYVISYKGWIGFEYTLPYSQIFFCVLPILAALPYAGSYYQDMHSGYMKNVCAKSSRKAYYLSKLSAVFMISSATIIIPMLLDLYVCAGLYPTRKPELLLADVPVVPEKALLSSVYSYSPVLYCIVFTLLDGIFAGLFGIFSVMISEMVESLFACLCLPFLIYLIEGMATADEKHIRWSFNYILTPSHGGYLSVKNLFSFLGVSAAVIVVWLVIRIKKKDVL